MAVTFEELRSRHAAARDAALPGYVARLGWTAEKIAAERERALRHLLAAAKAGSPWHRERLRDVDPASFTEADLPSLPVMTKAELMEHFDSVVTDPRLTRAVVDAHVERLPENPYLFDRYLIAASGGSSGRRGVFVYDWDEFVTFSCQILRWRMRLAPPTPPVVSLWAGRGAHVSWLGMTIFPPPFPLEYVSPTTPLPEMVGRLNAIQPKALMGYASTLHLLAREAHEGRLSITPSSVHTCGEPLLPEARAEIETVWPVHVDNYYGMSEGPYAFPCERGDAMHLPDDLHVIEPVDDAGRPVPPGTPAARLLVTNLFKESQPLIRYEVTDELVVVPEPCACAVATRRIDHVHGRSDDVFAYPGGVRVHPLALRAPLGKSRHVAEYQVLQTARGVHVRLVATDGLDERGLSQAIAAGLAGAGLAGPEVTLERVAELSRVVSGKLRRFVPLA
jgi:phenylacetate-coenzyme A ligase PaaK-like adenylate-forming protein